MQVLGVDGPRADGQRLPDRSEGSFPRSKTDLGASPQGSHTGKAKDIVFNFLVKGKYPLLIEDCC